MNKQYTTQTREAFCVESFATLADAIAFGISLKTPFDVSATSGAIVWSWEMRS